jgi:hypothetical protein
MSNASGQSLVRDVRFDNVAPPGDLTLMWETHRPRSKAFHFKNTDPANASFRAKQNTTPSIPEVISGGPCHSMRRHSPVITLIRQPGLTCSMLTPQLVAVMGMLLKHYENSPIALLSTCCFTIVTVMEFFNSRKIQISSGPDFAGRN